MRTRYSTCSVRRGFSLVELLVGAALLLVVSVASYRAYLGVMELVELSLDTIIATDLANEQIEIIRNLPYNDVGVENSVPDGVLPKERVVVRSGRTYTVTTSIRNVDDEFDGTIGGSPNDTAPADYRKAEVRLVCETCANVDPLTVTTRVAPKGLETSAGFGALFVHAFNANGEPVENADVRIENTTGDLTVDINEMTNNEGVLQIVNAPTSTQGYDITVTKDGFTTSQTYEPGAPANPNPIKPYATVAEGHVTEISFSVDEASALDVESVTDTCAPVSGLGFNMRGSKLIGTEPDVYKYHATSSTDGGGEISFADMEWDTYTLTPSDNAYTIGGITPPSPFVLSPGIVSDVSVRAVPQNPNHLLVTVLDAETGLPLSNATTTLEAQSGTTWDTKTGRGFLSQTNWSGGGGQEMYADETRYASADGAISDDTPPGEIKLKETLGEFVESGTLTSSTFDTGSPSNFHRIRWEPADQPISAGEDSVRFQVATAATDSPEDWSFVGPDGSSSSYYTVSDSTMYSGHDDDRYARYKVFLATDDTTVTPNVADVSFTFTSECVPAGQSFFDNLSAADYTLSVTKEGYETSESAVTIDSDWRNTTITLSPSS